MERAPNGGSNTYQSAAQDTLPVPMALAIASFALPTAMIPRLVLNGRPFSAAAGAFGGGVSSEVAGAEVDGCGAGEAMSLFDGAGFSSLAGGASLAESSVGGTTGLEGSAAREASLGLVSSSFC